MDASSFDPVLFYVAYYRSDDMDQSVLDLCDLFMLYDLAAGIVHQLPWEVLPGRKHAPEHCFSDQLLSFVPAGCRRRPSFPLDGAAWFVHGSLVDLVLVAWKLRSSYCMIS